MSDQNSSTLTIHQYTPSIAVGDGVGQGILFTQRLLRSMGISSEVFAHDIPPELAAQVRPADTYSDNTGQVLLIHHAMGHGYGDWLAGLSGKKFLIYHNITPAHFFADNDPIQSLLAQGRQQLVQWQSWLQGAIGMSPYNSDELIQAGFSTRDVASIPLLVDLEQLAQRRPDEALMASFSQQERPVLLFVGRLTGNKRQLFLLDAMLHLKQLLPAKQLPRLYLVGGGDTAYQKALEQKIVQYGLEADVEITGKVSEAALTSYYLCADAFVCVSQHEGFGMPLIEAMFYDLPVIAMDYGAIGSTLGRSGLLLDQGLSAEQLSTTLAVFLQNPELRSRLICSQRENLQRFLPAELYRELCLFLEQHQVALPKDVQGVFTGADCLVKSPGYGHYRVEGPFDSSYSLALLNRELARALEQVKPGQVGLLSTEGGGDFYPDADFLTERPEIASIYKQGSEMRQAFDASLRLLYPPRVNRMPGMLRVMANYGWEESVFPAEYGQGFNRTLNLVTTMSRYVSKVLRESGVYAPTRCIGVGVDHIERIQAEPVPSDLLEAIQGRRVFLHISSCFPRKGVDVLLNAWSLAFRYPSGEEEPRVILVLKTFTNPHNDTVQQLAVLTNELSRQGLSLPPVYIIEEDWRDGQIKALYQHSDVLVAPSRGEGFGLPMAEAMWLGVPVVTTGYGGQRDFCHEDNSWLLEYHFARAKTHMQQAGSVWAEPSVEHLSDILSGFYHQQAADYQPEMIQQRTDRARRLMQQHFCWHHVAERLNRSLDQAMEAVQAPPVQKQAQRLGWVSTWNSKCGIAAYSAYLLRPMAAPASPLAAACDQSWVLANTDAQLIQPSDDVLTCRGSHDADQRVVRCWSSAGSQGGDQGEGQLDQLYDTVCNLSLNQLVIQFNFGFFDLGALKTLLRRLQADKVKVMICFHSTADVYWGDVRKTLVDLLPELKQVAGVLVHSCRDLNRLKEWGIVDNAMLFPHGVSVPDDGVSVPDDADSVSFIASSSGRKGNPIREDHSQVQDRYQTMPDLSGKQVIASYGFMLPHKGIETLIDSFALLQKAQGAGQPYHLLLVNALYPVEQSSELLELCYQKVRHYGLEEQVSFISDFLPEEECLHWLKQADVVVFPYQHTQESSSAAVRTGLASKTPVLCTPLDIFEDVEQAVHFLPGTTAADIAQGVQDALEKLSDKNEREAWLARQQQWLDQHQWPVLAERMVGVLRALEQTDEH